MEFKIEPMNHENALKIAEWKYDEPYQIYSMGGADDVDCMKELMCGSYYSAIDQNGKLTGYFCFGTPAIVPAGRVYGFYDDTHVLDIGLGMDPELCGNGIGFRFMNAGLEYGRQMLGAKGFRLTVIVDNTRAIKVYDRLGFVRLGSFLRKSDIPALDLNFDVMILR